MLRANQALQGTVSIFPDSAAGVPCESLYPEEVAKLREQGIKFAEVGLLAVDIDKSTNRKYSLANRAKMAPLFMLFKILLNYAFYHGTSHLLIMVHPRHEELYRFLGFKPFAEPKPYEGACGNPAVPMMLDLDEEQKSASRSLRKFFLRNMFSPSVFATQLSQEPTAFADVFGESYYSYHERYVPSGIWSAQREA